MLSAVAHFVAYFVAHSAVCSDHGAEYSIHSALCSVVLSAMWSAATSSGGASGGSGSVHFVMQSAAYSVADPHSVLSVVCSVAVHFVCSVANLSNINTPALHTKVYLSRCRELRLLILMFTGCAYISY